MARGKTTPRMTTGGYARPLESQPAIALNRDGSVQRKKDPARERIKKMKAEFRRAMKMMDEALEIMDNIEEAFLDLEKTNFQDPEN